VLLLPVLVAQRLLYSLRAGRSLGAAVSLLFAVLVGQRRPLARLAGARLDVADSLLSLYLLLRALLCGLLALGSTLLFSFAVAVLVAQRPVVQLACWRSLGAAVSTAVAGQGPAVRRPPCLLLTLHPALLLHLLLRLSLLRLLLGACVCCTGCSLIFAHELTHLAASCPVTLPPDSRE